MGETLDLSNTNYGICPVCGDDNGQLKQHLVRKHGWRYSEESPNVPQAPTKGRQGTTKQGAGDE